MIAQTFTPRAIDTLSARIDEVTAELLDDMVALLLGGANHRLDSSGPTPGNTSRSPPENTRVSAPRALFERFPELDLTSPPMRRNLVTLRGYERLPTQLGHPGISEPAAMFGHP